MTKEMKALLRLTIKEDIIFGVIISLIVSIFYPIGALTFLLGIIIAGINFIVSGIILDKSLNAGERNILSTLSAILRILIIIIIALFLSKNMYNLLLYLAGFITHFPILIFGWIKSQKGSD